MCLGTDDLVQLRAVKNVGKSPPWGVLGRGFCVRNLLPRLVVLVPADPKRGVVLQVAAYAIGEGDRRYII